MDWMLVVYFFAGSIIGSLAYNEYHLHKSKKRYQKILERGIIKFYGSETHNKKQ